MIAVGYKYDIYILELFYKSRDNCLTILNRIEQRMNRTETETRSNRTKPNEIDITKPKSTPNPTDQC